MHALILMFESAYFQNIRYYFNYHHFNIVDKNRLMVCRCPGSGVRCGSLLYRFLMFAHLLTLLDRRAYHNYMLLHLTLQSMIFWLNIFYFNLVYDTHTNIYKLQNVKALEHKLMLFFS